MHPEPTHNQRQRNNIAIMQPSHHPHPRLPRIHRIRDHPLRPLPPLRICQGRTTHDAISLNKRKYHRKREFCKAKTGTNDKTKLIAPSIQAIKKVDEEMMGTGLSSSPLSFHVLLLLLI
ncbi:hypothetical protein V8E36_001582 [Tilletia maclaganii]